MLPVPLLHYRGAEKALEENLSVFDFALTPGEVASIDALDTGVRGGPNQDEIDFLSWNRTIPE